MFLTRAEDVVIASRKPSAKLTPQRDFWVTFPFTRLPHPLFGNEEEMSTSSSFPNHFVSSLTDRHVFFAVIVALILSFGFSVLLPGTNPVRPRWFFIVFAKHKRADFLFDMTAPVTFASDTSSHLIIFREKNKNQTTRAGFCLTFEQVTSLWWTLCCPLHSLGYERIEKLRIWPSTTFELCKIELLSLKWHSWFDLRFLEGFTWEWDKLLKTLEKNFVKM